MTAAQAYLEAEQAKVVVVSQVESPVEVVVESQVESPVE